VDAFPTSVTAILMEAIRIAVYGYMLQALTVGLKPVTVKGSARYLTKEKFYGLAAVPGRFCPIVLRK
jgi:hypothetical protein